MKLFYRISFPADQDDPEGWEWHGSVDTPDFPHASIEEAAVAICRSHCDLMCPVTQELYGESTKVDVEELEHGEQWLASFNLGGARADIELGVSPPWGPAV